MIGVLDAPARGEMLARGGGAGARGATACGSRAARARELAGARVPADALPKADRDLVAVAKPNSIALRIAMVAADEADLVATLRWGNEWDIAAAALIAGEAGARVTDALGQPLAFNKPDPQAFGVLASAPGLHRGGGRIAWLGGARRDRSVRARRALTASALVPSSLVLHLQDTARASAELVEVARLRQPLRHLADLAARSASARRPARASGVRPLRGGAAQRRRARAA